MNRKISIAAACILLLGGTLTPTRAQNYIRPLNLSLNMYDTVNNRTILVGPIHLIKYLMGTNVPNGHLYLVTPVGNPPGTIGALGAFLRVTSGTRTVYEFPSVTQFNLYQDVVAFRTNSTSVYIHAINRFSFDTGGVRAELQAKSIWTVSGWPVNGVVAGAFTCSVNGWIEVNETHGTAPIAGTIYAGRATYGP